MPRGSHRETKSGPSQRALRAGEVIRYAVISVTLLLIPTFAAAEVCDKAVGENWRQQDGPAWLFNPGFPYLLTVLVCVVLTLVIAKQIWWPAYVLAALMLLKAAAIFFADIIPEHTVYLAQLREGCRSRATDIADIALFVGIASVLLGFGYRARRSAAQQ